MQHWSSARRVFVAVSLRYVNDLEAELEIKGISDIYTGMINLCILLYADDIILFGKIPEEFKNALEVLEEYCKRWKVTVNTNKTKERGAASKQFKFHLQ